MEYVRGLPIGYNWSKRPEAEREELLKQLKGFFEELRKIPHSQPGAICTPNTKGIGPLTDQRFYSNNRQFGPFANEADFNDFLQWGLDQADAVEEITRRFGKETVPELEKMVAIQRQEENHRICFTHGDAGSGKFLVKGDKTVSLVDFETSGFYPEHWEYTTAMITARDRDVFEDSSWELEIGKFLDEYPKELEGETIRQNYYRNTNAVQAIRG